MDELYVVARRVLLDALEALGPHRDAMVLVGAQAIYLQVGEADLAVAPYTTDGDLAIDPVVLGTAPPLEQALLSGGFRPKSSDSVGLWITHQATAGNPRTPVAIDLLVPDSVSPGQGRRAADLPGHDRKAARKVRGLEGAIVDSNRMQLASLTAEDPRVVEMRVGGPAALLVAKLHKIQERTGTPRASDKDALDVFRLLRGTSTEDLAERYSRLRTDPRSSEVSKAAEGMLRQLFADPHGIGIEMTVRATRGLTNPREISASCVILAKDLLHELTG